MIRHLKTYIHKHSTKSIITQSVIFCGPKLQTFHCAIFLAKTTNLLMTHNYPSPSYTQETYCVVVTTSKPTLYFYNTFLLLSSSHYSMWNFSEYSVENQHILPSPKVSHAMEQTFDTPPTYMLEPLLLLVIQHIFLDHSYHWWSTRTRRRWQSFPSLTLTAFRLAHQTRCR